MAEAAAAVVLDAGQQAALGAQHFIINCPEVADHPAIEVELALVGSGQGFQVAQGVVRVLQVTGITAFAEQLIEGVIAKFQLLLFAVVRFKSDRQQVVVRVLCLGSL